MALALPVAHWQATSDRPGVSACQRRASLSRVRCSAASANGSIRAPRILLGHGSLGEARGTQDQQTALVLTGRRGPLLMPETRRPRRSSAPSQWRLQPLRHLVMRVSGC